MSALPLASVVISSYNYGTFLPVAIDSALGQTYPHTEVIVVDDGSTDHSRKVIAGYGRRVVPLLKQNGGQASAFNAGFRASRGEVVFFVDSDDALLPTAVERAVEALREGGVGKVHWPLREIDSEGRPTGNVIRPNVGEGDFREAVIRGGPYSYAWPDTSGNAWARAFLERVLPMPEPEFRTCPDFYLCGLAPLFGSVRRILEPQSCWRAHGQNNSATGSLQERVRVGLWRDEQCFACLARYCREMGFSGNIDGWRANSCWYEIDLSLKAIAELVPENNVFILVDQDEWGGGQVLDGWLCVPFLGRNGVSWGPPPDDCTAIRELERLRQVGANFIVFASPALWWLDYYSGFHRHLQSAFRRVFRSGYLVVFDLRR
jgi:glycosyltransferase involved in cell wall biosynthesis